MSRSQSWKNLAPEGEKAVDLRRASSQPLYTPQTSASESNFAASNSSFRSSMEDMRRRIVHLNKELEQERMHSKNLKRDKALEVRQVRDEEQRKATAMQADLKSKLHKEKMNELTSLREQLHKEKEKDIVQIIRQKDETFRSAQQAWAKEKEELKSKVRNELRGEAREDTKREFEKERGRLEQDIAELHRQKRELEDTLKLVQDADKRKIDDIRRIHHEHESELEKFKRNSWQESRQQMAEIRQLLNIIEQLEKKLGLEAGHSMRLRLEKDSLSDMLKKSSTFDAWDRMMSSSVKGDQVTPQGTPDSKGGSQELRMLQRKNVELSSLVRKLDEKNQQLATRNAELLAELEKLGKDNRDKNRKLERKNTDLAQTNKRLESRNKMLLDEVNALKKTLTGRKENSVKPRGRTSKEQDELGNLKAQMREQTRTIADLKQSLMEKDRRIELLRGRKKKSKRQPASLTSLSADFLPVTDDDALSVHSDFSEASEMSSSDDVDSKRIKKLAKELLALERAYALLQAHVGSAVDAERDEMEKQQLQSDLLQSQTRIHELERMMNDSGQGTGSEEMTQLQADNKALYQKLVTAEKSRDEAQGELAKYTEHMRDLQDQRDLLEFELEEMSQLSTAGSEDWDSRRPRSSLDASPSLRMMDNDSAILSLEEIKACLEELETEKENVLSPVQQNALKQARVMLESMAEKINHMEITESALRDKVRDLDLGYNSESMKSEFDESRSLSVITCDRETLTDLQWGELDDLESFYREQRLEGMDDPRHADLGVPTEDSCCMTDLIWEDLVSMENMYKKYLNGFPEGLGTNGGQFDMEKDDKECMTDLVWQDLEELEETYRNLLEELSPPDFTDGKSKGFNPVHLVVRQTDGVDAFPTDEHPDRDFSPEHPIVLEETAPLSNAPEEFSHLSEDSPASPGVLSNEGTDPDSSLLSDDGDAFSKDIGVQCDLVDVLAMLAEYQRNANDEDMPWFVSAMNMQREDPGFNPVQVTLRNRSDSSPVQDGVVNTHSNSLVVNLSRPPPPPSDTTFTIGSQPTEQITENDQSEFPEADTPLFTSQDGSDGVFNTTDESMNLSNDAEERDVLTDMPRDSSAVNRYDRFLKERKDSELLNLMVLREGMDDGGIEGVADVKSLKEVVEENELLRKHVQFLESGKNTEELENENALLKEKVESVQDLEEENQLLKEEIDILRQSTAVEDIEEENGLLKDKIKMLEEMAISDQDIRKIEEENDELRERVKTLEETAVVSELEMKKAEEENEELKEKIETLVESLNTEELEKENDYLKQQVAMLAAEPERVKELEEENEILHEKIQALEASADVVVNEDALLKEQIDVLEENEVRVKELEDEKEILKEKVQILEESSNVEDLVSENALLKEQIEIMEETGRVKELEDENEILKEKVQILEESSNVEDLVNENALLKEQIEIMEETGRSRVKELEDDNEILKEKVQILEESSAAEGREQEQLMEKIQDLEGSTGRVVETLEEENSMLKDNIQILEDSTTNMKELEDENALLRKKIESLNSSRNIQELKEENSSLKEKIRSLEESTQARDLSTEEFELLQLKIEQLKEAEKKIGALNESNVALRERIDLLQLEKKNVKDNSSEMDPSEQLGKVRLLLVQDFGLTASEVESVLGSCGSCDLESLVSSGMATPRAEFNNLGHYFEQADRGIQAEAGDVPPSVGESMQRLPGISVGVNQEIQTNLDSVALLEGYIPEHIAKELEKLQQENRELYEELMELRSKVQGREIAERLHEATQTEHAQFPADLAGSRDVISPVPSSIEETITPQVRSTVATEVRYLGDRRLEFELSPRSPYIQFESAGFEGKNDVMDYSGTVSDSEVENTMPSYHENARDSDELISEPELVSARRNLDSHMDDIDQRIHDLRYMDDEDRPRTGTSDLVGFDSDDDGDLPPLPESSPPPLPSEPPPDFPETSSPVLDGGLEVLLRSESSPPRNAATLRASSRQRFHSDNKSTSEYSLPSSRVESPVTVEEPTLVLESEPSELGGMYPMEDPSPPSPSSIRRPTGLGSIKAPPQVLPKPKRILLQKRQPGPLNQPMVSYVDSNVAPSQWSRDEEDGVIPPRGIVRNRAASLNRGEIDALNEKIGFLERQLKNKENIICSMKTEATELETQSLLERKDREMKILDEDVAFLKQENQKKERELLTKIGEMNKRSYEIEQWKAEANNSERQRQRMEAAYMNLQNQLKSLHGAELKLAELQTKYSGMEKQNFELSEKVKKLERTEREFKKLEHNIQLLQAQVQEMDVVEQDRNNLMEKMKTIENQRDDLLRKGRVVESERNDFLRNNKLMEMQRDDLENRCAMLQKTNNTLNSRLAELEHDMKEAQTKMHDSQHERNFLQVQLDKIEAERNEMQTRLAITTQERNSLENQVAELQDLNRDHVKLEDGFHSLRIKLAESTRLKDDAEMQIPTLKAKISLLKRACKEKDELVDKLGEEIRELRHSIATSALDDMSKIRSYGYSPENFVKLSAQREQERQIAKRDPEDLVEERLQSRLEQQSPRRSPKGFEPSPPGTKKAKRFVALFDYDPHKSPASEHPELELKLKEGDFLTVFGDMDINGYFEADVNGVRGLVPSLYVEEVEDDNDSDIALEEQLTRTRRNPVKDIPTASHPLKEVPSFKGSELQLYRDNMSSGHCTPSSGASSAGSEPRQCMVALHNYDPFHSGASGLRPPHEQLSFKKGDVMTAFGDMDVNGFYRVDLNGQTGFVPGQLVEEVSSSSFLQPTSSRAPEQILGMLDNIQVRGQPKASSTHMFTPNGVIANGYPTPTHALGNVTPPRHVRLPSGPHTSPSQVRLPGSPDTSPSHVRLPGGPDTSLSHVRPPGGPISPLPNVGLTRFKPSPEVAMLGPSTKTAVIPVNSTQSSQRPVPSVGSQKPLKASLPPSASKQIVAVVSNKSRSRKARPSAPSGFRIIRPVNHDAMLVGWTLPEMDEFGRSNGLTVKGYKIYANSDVKLDVRSPYMAKALVEDLELRFPIKFSVKTVAENGSSSETVTATFNDTIKGSIMDSCGESFEDSGDEQSYRTFVALYDYDPFKSSPNPNPATELCFKEGDILRVFDTSRKDGFYVGKLKNKKGLIPSNFVEEVAVASPRRLAAAKKRQAALPSPTRPISWGSSSSGGVASPALITKNPAPLRKKMMVALYDYNPEVQSPQDNPDSELPFKKGQILTVIDEMRADGFYHADLNGQLGLVPGSFLDEYINGETDSGLESGRRVSFEKGRSQRHLGGLSRT